MTATHAERRRSWFGLVVVLALTLLTPAARATVLMMDAADEAEVAEAGSAGRWEAFAVTSAKSNITNEGRALTVALAPGDRATFSRAADLAPEPTAVLCTFNVSLAQIGPGKQATQVFRMGWDFSASVTDEADAKTYARLGLAAAAGGEYQLRDLVGGNNSEIFRGTQAVSWALNNSGRSLSYDAPNGAIETVANDRMDVWVGRIKVFDDIAATNPAGRMTDLKWSWNQGSGVTSFDHFEIRTLDEATGAARVVPAEVAAAQVDESAGNADESLALDRPTPNPFLRSMRFAYAISGGPTPVDIGVFDIAGRRIRGLARGIQGTGRYEVRWDGLGDDGARVKYGVYFLRAAVGANNRVSRVVYMSH